MDFSPMLIWVRALKIAMTEHHIAIVDDHPLFRDALKQTLAASFDDLRISEAGSLEGLSTLIEAGDVDLVLLDLSMPGVQGFSGLIYLRSLSPQIPVVIVSANESPAVIRRCLEFGASGFIPKSLGVSRIREGDCRDFSRRDLGAGRRRPRWRGEKRLLGAGGAPRLAHPAAGARADDAGRGPVEQADRVSPRRVRGDGESPCFRHPAKAEGGKPHPGGDRRQEDRKWRAERLQAEA